MGSLKLQATSERVRLNFTMMVELNRFENGIILDALLHMSYRFNFCTQLSNWQMHKKKGSLPIRYHRLGFAIPGTYFPTAKTSVGKSENSITNFREWWGQIENLSLYFFPRIIKTISYILWFITIFSYITLGLVNGFPMVDISFCSALFNFGFELL